MDLFSEVDRIGFYPRLVNERLRPIFASGAPSGYLTHVETAFDDSSVFRHLTVLGADDHVLCVLHVDELDEGVVIGSNVTPLSRVRSLALTEVVTSPEDGRVTEANLSINLGGSRRFESEPALCADPDCTGDHGDTGVSYPEDVNLRLVADSHEPDAPTRAARFAGELTRLLRVANG